MGLLNKKDDDAGKVLEKMMEQFDIDLGEIVDDTKNENNELNRRRKEKKEAQ